MQKSRLIIRKPKAYISLYEVPTDQRATLWVWLKHKHLDLQLHTLDSKSDELGLVHGCKYSDYINWYDDWNGYVFFPAMHLQSEGRSLTVKDCDLLLHDDDGKFIVDYDEEVVMLKEDLISFMVFPFRHDDVTLIGTGNTHTYYKANIALDIIFQKAMKNPFMLKLYNRKIEILKEVTNSILLTRYDYKNTFYI